MKREEENVTKNSSKALSKKKLSLGDSTSALTLSILRRLETSRNPLKTLKMIEKIVRMNLIK